MMSAKLILKDLIAEVVFESKFEDFKAQSIFYKSPIPSSI